MNTTTEAPLIFREIQRPLLSFVSDEYLALIMPIAAYWIISLGFYLLDQTSIFEEYRLHTPEELAKRNKCSLGEVLRAVSIQHVIQTIMGLTLAHFEDPQYTGHEDFEIWRLSQQLSVPKNIAHLIYFYGIPAMKIAVAFFIVDTWQYFLHRLMHSNKFLYKHLHSIHHRLYVPYAFGALYNSVIEGFILDTAGAGLAHLITGINARESIIFYTFSTIKTVDDHCGYALPWDPFQILFPNNAVYHDIHHQYFGIKTNFSQPFFTIWDRFLNTEYKGTQSYAAQQKEIRTKRHKEHLEAKKLESLAKSNNKKLD